MRKIFLLALFFFPLATYGQSEDTLKYKHGFLVEFDVATIRQIGFRYCFSNTERILLTANAYYDMATSESSNNSDIKRRSFGGSCIWEHRLYRLNLTSLFVGTGIRAQFYSDDLTTKPPANGRNSPETWTSHGYDLSALIGLGAEYAIGEQFTLSCFQEAELKRSKQSDSGGDHLATTIRLVNVRVALTIYF